jgi:hypothetical protein
MNKTILLSIALVFGLLGTSAAQKLFIGACADAFLLHVQNTSINGLADARSKIGFSGGADVYLQLDNTLILGLGYNVEKITMYDDAMTYNVAMPAHNIYMILGTGIVRDNLFVNFLGKLGYTAVAKPKDMGPHLHEYNYKTNDNVSGGFKINVGGFITPRFAASLQTGLYYYPFQIVDNSGTLPSSFFTVPFGISLNYVISY